VVKEACPRRVKEKDEGLERGMPEQLAIFADKKIE
jgi:hypothetical protein